MTESMTGHKIMAQVKRLCCAFLPQLAKPDDAFAQAHLPLAEWQLYRKMDVRDRDHACRVARRLQEKHPKIAPEALRAAFLHDVGKIVRPFDAWLRFVSGLYVPRRIALTPQRGGLQGAWQVKRHHPEIGARMILRAGGSERVAELVAKHHAPGSDTDALKLHAVDVEF